MNVAAAILRRGDEIVLVRQAAPGEQPFCALPGGVLAESELVTQGLRREVLEETGLKLVDPRLAFVLQVDDQGAERPRLWTVWTFEARPSAGDPAPRDPDGFVSEAACVPLDEAIERLGAVPWLAVAVQYLRGEIEPRSLHLQRRLPDGRIETL